jgi:Family of unknown function (DUF6074)
MSGVILPFPRARDRGFVARHAALMESSTTDAAERHLFTQLDVQRRTMLKRGIDPDVAEEHIRALELAIRVELWRRVIRPGGAA